MSEDIHRSRSEMAYSAARVARDVVDGLLLEIGGLGRYVDRRALLGGLESARSALDALERSRPDDLDHLDHYDAARARLAACVEAVLECDVPDAERLARRIAAVGRSLDEARQEAIDVMVAGQTERIASERGARPELGAAQLSTSWLGSVGAPRLFEVARTSLSARVDRAIPHDFESASREEEPVLYGPNEDDTLETLLAASNPPEAEPRLDDVRPESRLEVLLDGAAGSLERAEGHAGELAQLNRLARTCLDDIGAAGNLRRLEPDERFEWAPMAGFEQRMCDALDALMALSTPFVMAGTAGVAHPGLDVLELAQTYGRESLTADPGRAFARTFVLGSVRGEDTARAAILAVKQSPRYTHRAEVQALSLSSNPAVAPALVTLCEEPGTDLLRLALDAMHARRHDALASVAPLIEHIDDGIRARAYRGLASATERGVAADLIAQRLPEETSEWAAAEAAEALLVLGDRRGLEYARQRLSDDLDEPGALAAAMRQRLMMLLAIAGAADDHRLLAASYRGGLGDAIALGYHGHWALAELLHGAICRPFEPYVLGEFQVREAAEALIRITGAPLVRAKEDRYDAETSDAKWALWWREFADELPKERRLRFGRPFSPLSSVAELEADAVPVRIRGACALELAVALREPPIAIDAFVAAQRREIARTRATVEARLAEGTLSVGTWR